MSAETTPLGGGGGGGGGRQAALSFCLNCNNCFLQVEILVCYIYVIFLLRCLFNLKQGD